MSSVVNLSVPAVERPQQNKTDFYRYLLTKNDSQGRVFNDVLIPRSIRKSNNPGNLTKDLRLEEATRDYYTYQ